MSNGHIAQGSNHQVPQSRCKLVLVRAGQGRASLRSADLLLTYSSFVKHLGGGAATTARCDLFG